MKIASPRVRLHALAPLLAVALLACAPAPAERPQTAAADEAIAAAFEQHRGNLEVEGQGVVTRVLADDRDGARHQRFILRLKSGRTVLVAHNIDRAPRVDGLRAGDEVQFKGEYEWNPQGGVLHWTHRDPEGRHAAGWLKHGGRTFQ